METDPGASLDRLIAALRQYQVASAAGETSSAALAGKKEVKQTFSCRWAGPGGSGRN